MFMLTAGIYQSNIGVVDFIIGIKFMKMII